MIHDWTIYIYIFMTLLNVLATPEEIIKIYIQTKKLCHFNNTFIKK